MDSQQLSPDENNQSNQFPSEPVVKQPFWKAHLGIILVIIAVLVVGGIAAALISNHKNKSTNPDSSVNTSRGKNKSTAQSSISTNSNSNIWKGAISDTSIPLGDGKVSTTPQVGYVDSCTTSFKGGGARHSGSWIDSTTDTWDSASKPAVEGSVTWSSASYSATTSGDSRTLQTNDLPEGYPTGNFPISSSDPAYQYDTNPNHIAAQDTTYALPLNSAAASAPNCLGLGPIGVLSDGVFLYDALDAAGRDAGAHEVQDNCNGHPDGSDRYHYHSVSSCILGKATGSSTLVGYALDGYGIYVERDSKGNLPTNADLDACHGRTSQVMWDGKLTDIYHYDATLEYPYTVGCYHGTPITTRG